MATVVRDPAPCGAKAPARACPLHGPVPICSEQAPAAAVLNAMRAGV